MTQPDRDQKAGDILLEEGLISQEDVDQALAIQKKNKTALTADRERLFGMILCDLSLITPMDNYCTLDRHGKLMSVEAYLVRKQILTKSRLDRLAAQARERDIPLLSFLVDQKVVAKSLLQQILFDLFHIPLRSVSDIVFEKGSQKTLASMIRREAAERHRCIPLQLNGSSVLVGITDPSNLLFLKGLDQSFPQYRFTPVFIPFSGFTWFYRLLYGKNWEERQDRETPPLDRAAESSVVITDPDSEKNKVWALFDRYEALGRPGRTPELKQNRGKSDRKRLFWEFIRENHSRIAHQGGGSRIRYSLKQEGGKPLVMASPEPEESL